jgi:carbamoyltransferase
MNIIGISGFANAVSFKRTHWPGLDEREYRISQGHDAAAALVAGGVTVAAAAEERFNRQKHSAAFPIHAISYCLKEAGISIRDVDEIAHSFDYRPYQKIFSVDPLTSRLYGEVFSREVLLDAVHRDLPGFPDDRVHHVSHHEAHAASAWLTSGWDECLVVVIDGMGEAHGCSIYEAVGGRLRPIRHFSAKDSIGIFYSILTLHLGFDFNSDEYKVMGLAPYGDPSRFRAFFESAVRLEENGGISIPALRLNVTREERENYGATRKYLCECLGPPRKPDDRLTQTHRDIAAALQQCLNRAVIHIAENFGRQTGLRRLAMAGGVALNCVANAQLAQSGVFDDVYVQPAAGDDGSALGAALARSAFHGQICNRRSPAPFFGPASAPGEIERALRNFNGRIEITRFSSTREACAAAARLIASGHVIAWHRGRMEFGPRALGNRSILADPGHPEMRDRINAMVKKREAFRPFAPAVSIEQAQHWFDLPPGADFRYMIQTADVRPEHRSALPAVTHVDGSARVQTVSADDNPDFHMLLKEVGAATGREMVLNTSFNVKGQPIVNTPQEAIETFLGTGIEFLFLENTQVARKNR